MASTFSPSPNLMGFGSESGSTLSRMNEVSRKESVKSWEMRALSPPSSQHSDGKDLALLTAQGADGIPRCSEPRVCFRSLEHTADFM